MEQHEVIDLSHPISDGLVTYPGLPTPVIRPFLTYEASRSHYDEGTEFSIDSIELVGSTGTYLDAPAHRFAGSTGIAGLDLARLVGLRAEVFHFADAWTPERRGISASMIDGRDVAGAAVLVHTGWDVRFGTPDYGSGAPFLTEDAAQWLVDSGALLVGIDSVNVDDTESGGARPTHTTLLRAGVPIVENLTNLAALPPHGARFTAVPPAIVGTGTFTVRAFAQLA